MLKVICKAFEDNKGVLELARFSKMRLRTKHANKMHHYFRSHVAEKLIEIFSIDAAAQIKGMLIKPLLKDQFKKCTSNL